MSTPEKETIPEGQTPDQAAHYYVKYGEKIKTLTAAKYAAFKEGISWAHRHLSSQPSTGLRWVNAGQRMPEDIHNLTMRLIGTKRCWNGSLEIQQGLIVGPHGNIFPPTSVEWLEETPSVQPIEGEQKTGIYLIAQERREQIEKHGRTLESDRLINPDGQLCWAASMLLVTEDQESPMDLLAGTVLKDWNQKILMKMSAKPYKDRLIIAGALIAAEIDRIQNAQPAVVPEAQPTADKEVREATEIEKFLEKELSTQVIQIAGLLASNKEWGEKYAEIEKEAMEYRKELKKQMVWLERAEYMVAAQSIKNLLDKYPSLTNTDKP